LVELPSVEDGNGDSAAFESLIIAKAAKKKNVKYTATTLTHYLQPQLETNPKVLVIVHLDPCDANTALKSLELATKVTGGKSINVV
jgi:thioredoxin reductase